MLNIPFNQKARHGDPTLVVSLLVSRVHVQLFVCSKIIPLSDIQQDAQVLKLRDDSI